MRMVIYSSPHSINNILLKKYIPIYFIIEQELVLKKVTKSNIHHDSDSNERSLVINITVRIMVF